MYNSNKRFYINLFIMLNHVYFIIPGYLDQVMIKNPWRWAIKWAKSVSDVISLHCFFMRITSLKNDKFSRMP